MHISASKCKLEFAFILFIYISYVYSTGVYKSLNEKYPVRECIPYAKMCDKTRDCLMDDDEGCHLAACHAKKCSHLRLYNNSTECFSPPSILYYSTGQEIRALNILTQSNYPLVEMLKAEIIVDMAFWPTNNKLVYIASKEGSHGSIYQVDLSGTNQRKTNSRLLSHEDLKGIEGISIDWLAGHFYLTESSSNRIVVCNMDSVFCATLMRDLNLPRGILTIPLKGKLYWTQWGEGAGIFESGMDGDNPSLLIDNVSWPNDLAFDETMNRLYWCDGKDGTIEYYDLANKMRHTVFQDHNRQPYSLFVFEDSLYWSDWATNTIEVCNITGHKMKPLVMDVKHFFSVIVYHPRRQNVLNQHNLNACNQSLCSHLCLLKEGAQSYSCACPDHMVLTEDKDCFISKTKHNSLYIYASHSSDSENSNVFIFILKIVVFISLLLPLLCGMIVSLYYVYVHMYD